MSSRPAVDRERLVLEHLPLARSLARRRAAASGISYDDLLGPAQLGLVEAAARWRPDGGAQFGGFAYRRVNGAITDHMRSEDPLSRSQRHRATRLEHAARQLAARNGREPSDEELAGETGCTPAQVRRSAQALATAWPLRLDAVVIEDDEGRAMVGDVLADPRPGPDAEVQTLEQRRALRRLLGGLRPREQLVIRLSFHEERTLREIAELLAVTESRVCQIRQAALARLRAALAEAP